MQNLFSEAWEKPRGPSIGLLSVSSKHWPQTRLTAENKCLTLHFFSCHSTGSALEMLSSRKMVQWPFQICSDKAQRHQLGEDWAEEKCPHLPLTAQSAHDFQLDLWLLGVRLVALGSCTVARQASLCITNSQSLPKLMSIESICIEINKNVSVTSRPTFYLRIALRFPLLCAVLDVAHKSLACWFRDLVITFYQLLQDQSRSQWSLWKEGSLKWFLIVDRILLACTKEAVISLKIEPSRATVKYSTAPSSPMDVILPFPPIFFIAQ